MHDWSRRTFLTGSLLTITSLAGCAGSSSDSPPEDSSPTTGATPKTTATEPTCDTTSADGVFEVTPRGVTMLTDSPSAAESLRTDLESLETETRQDDTVRIVSVERGGTERGAIEIDGGITTPEALTEAFGDRDTVIEIRRGRSLRTSRTIATQTRQYIRDAGTLDPSDHQVQIVTPDPPAPFTVVTTLSGIDDRSILDAADSLEMRVTTEDGERTLLSGSLIHDASVQSDPTPGVVFSLTDEGQRAFRRGLERSNALAPGTQRSVRLYFDGERIYDAAISRSLAGKIESGDWQGELLVRTAAPERARELADAMNLLTYDVPVETRFTRCE